MTCVGHMYGSVSANPLVCVSVSVVLSCVDVWVCACMYMCATAPIQRQGVSIMINRQTRRLSHAITLHYGSQDFKVKMNGSSSTWRLHISSFFFLFLLLLLFGRDLSSLNPLLLWGLLVFTSLSVSKWKKKSFSIMWLNCNFCYTLLNCLF